MEKTYYQIKWDRFINGHWTKRPPTKEGTYPVCEISEKYTPVVPSNTIIVKSVKGQPCYFRSHPWKAVDIEQWSGHFWTESLPTLIQNN